LGFELHVDVRFCAAATKVKMGAPNPSRHFAALRYLVGIGAWRSSSKPHQFRFFGKFQKLFRRAAEKSSRGGLRCALS
jgi:hypothetical protein